MLEGNDIATAPAANPQPAKGMVLGFSRLAALLGAAPGESSLKVLLGVYLVWFAVSHLLSVGTILVSGSWEHYQALTGFATHLLGAGLYLGALHAGLRWLGSRRWIGVALIAVAAMLVYRSLLSVTHGQPLSWEWQVTTTVASALGVTALGLSFGWIRRPILALWVGMSLDQVVHQIASMIAISFMFPEGLPSGAYFGQALGVAVHCALMLLVAFSVIAVRRRLAPWPQEEPGRGASLGPGAASTAAGVPVAGGGFFEPELAGVRMGILGGILMMGIAVLWFVGGLAFDVIFYYPPVLFCFGLYAFFKGLVTGNLAGRS